MSAGEGSGVGRREVAYRVFAAEYDDADFQYTENEADERAPNYVVTPTGARVNRLFVVGVLTEIERVNEEMLRGRIVDPTGAFVVYAGQYQPDALTAIERLDPPAFVAVTGKARTFQPEDAETIYTSVRPESINEVDADTRDRWTVGTARHTLDRVAACADAMEREERGEELTAALSADGVDHGLAAGIPLALEHYGTTPTYLDAVREMAVEAVELVAGEREEVTPLGLAPGEGGAADVDLPTGESFTAADSSATAGSATTAGETGDTEPTAGSEATASGETTTESASEATDSEVELEDVGSGDGKSTGAADENAASDERDTTGSEPDTTADEPSAATDEMYQFDDDEREEIESEFGTDFSTGAEVDEPGESNLDAPDPGGTEPTAETEPEGVSGASEQKTGTTEESDDETGAAGEPAATEEPEPSEESAEDVDLEDAVVGAMRDLDSGDGADRNAVIEAVSDEHGAAPEEVEEAIQDALMSGTCYEPGDGLLKAI